MYLAIDYGTKRTGLAAGSVIPRAAGLLTGNKTQNIEAIARLVLEREVEAVVVGLPTRSQGEEGTLSAEIKQFASQVSEQTGLPVYFEEEKFTSTEAEQYLKELRDVGVSTDRVSVDEIAATLILEQFISRDEKGTPAFTQR